MWHIKNNKSMFAIVDNLQSTLYLLKNDEEPVDENVYDSIVFDAGEGHEVYFSTTKSDNSNSYVRGWTVNKVLDDYLFETKEEAEEYLNNNIPEKQRDRVTVKELFIMSNHF